MEIHTMLINNNSPMTAAYGAQPYRIQPTLAPYPRSAV
jgi:hypothetical protein